MYIPIVAIFTLLVVAAWETPETHANPLQTVTPIVSEASSLELTQPRVRSIQVRFLNRQGKPVDESDRPIEGRTQIDFILEQLQLKSGEAFSQDVLEKDLRRLRRLDLFEEVNVSLQPEAAEIDVIFDLKERRFPSIGFGGGISDDIGLHGRVGYQDRNIGGINQQFGVNVQVSGVDVQFDTQFITRDRPDNLFGYSIKAFRRRGFSPTFNQDVNLPNGDDVREGRFGGGVALLKSFEDWEAAFGLNYTRVSLRDRNWNVSPVDQFGNRLSLSNTGIDDLVTVSFALTRDDRDRASNPTQGSILTLSTEQSIPVGLGNVLINRLQANYIQYTPMNWLSRGEAIDPALAELLALNLQAGTILGDFPPAEAFNLGGFNSVRGYKWDTLGSGRSYVLGSVEYRFPIVPSIGGVVFADFGSDLGSASTVLGEPGILRQKPGTGFGYGLGLRVQSPLGLIRADFGVSDRGESLFEVTTNQRF